MDVTEKMAQARFKIGDRVLLVGPHVWIVTGRYWRKSLGGIVYAVRSEYGGPEIRVREAEVSTSD